MSLQLGISIEWSFQHNNIIDIDQFENKASSASG